MPGQSRKVKVISSGQTRLVKCLKNCEFVSFRPMRGEHPGQVLITWTNLLDQMKLALREYPTFRYLYTHRYTDTKIQKYTIHIDLEILTTAAVVKNQIVFVIIYSTK